MNIFVANLNFHLKVDNLQKLFEEYGEVISAKIIKDKQTGKSKGFGFIEMPNEEDALRAIEELNGTEIEGRPIVVKKANPKNQE